MRLFATKSPDGQFVSLGRHEAEACYRASVSMLEDRWEILASKGWTVEPVTLVKGHVTLTELPAESEERRGDGPTA